jgi:hypothetical protein
LYVKQMAWLNATPEGLKESRIDFFRRNLKRDPDFPPTNGCEYLLEYFFSIGVGRSSGMGFCAIDWQEIDAWCRRKKLNLTGWESETIFMLSSAYVSQSAISKQKSALPPYSSNTEAQGDKESIGKSILKAFESLSSKSKKAPPQKRGKKAEA